MKKSYQTTIEDSVETNFRLAEIIGIVAKQRWLGLIWGLIMFPIIYYLGSHSHTEKLILATLMSLVIIVVHLLTFKGLIRNQYRTVLIKAHGTKDPIPCEYELTDENLIFRKLGQELRFSWQNVEKINITPASIEVLMRPTGLAIIPTRIFDGSEEREEWIRYIENHQKTQHTIRS